MEAAPIARDDITGLVLAGGLGRRMGGADKGLLDWQGRPLAAHALARLAPQVGTLALSANRNSEAYAAFGVPVLADLLPGALGPLAGLLAGLRHARTRWLAVVPCDAPRFPVDLVARLAAGRAGAAVVYARAARTHPVFCLVDTTLAATLEQALARGERRVEGWLRAQGGIAVDFDDETAFANFNTPESLHDD
ncbi:molybdenum cofactor guanylyltransferase MobA [Rubrivivax gelatinosus]|uniref:molybdenum cofactor guanylyltransferase MobA n=1 Tax=Rubrivivax gelatinosus TaxID=28068 RepID=UPI00190431E7|nr:molybdenum cofactor guanylyltransferase MobA [Rubrivivax gelatinosus]MBK1615430.1 molybdenum cofactor guanylyltransferase MobA [Rubrivivax gelatinosus]